MLWNRKVVLLLLLLLIVTIRLAVNYLSPDIVHPDAIMQSLEQAHRLVFGVGFLPWEFIDGVRSWFFPGFLAIFVYLGSFLGPGSYGYIFLCDLVLNLLSLLPVLYVCNMTYRKYGQLPALLASVIMGLTWVGVYFANRALTECVATNVFFGALLFAQDKALMRSENKHHFLVGFLLGLTFCLRIQYGLAVALSYYILCFYKQKFRWHSALGFALVALIFGFSDWFTWKWPFQSMLLYFKFNGLEGKAANWGISPWYGYLLDYVRQFTVSLLLFLPLAWRGLRISPLLGIVFLSVLVPHCFIPHKEFRFVHLATMSLLALSALGGAQFLHSPRGSRIGATKTFALACAVLLCLALCRSLWVQDNGHLHAFRHLSLDSEMTGVGIQKHVENTGGYYYLHRNVPILFLEKYDLASSHLGNINRIIAPQTAEVRVDGIELRKTKCFGATCIYAVILNRLRSTNR